jgi:subtilisin family serine protease
MKISIYKLLLISFLSVNSSALITKAAESVPSSKLSPFASKMLEINKNEELLSSSESINVLLKFDDRFDFKKAKSYGVKFSTKVSNICTALIPISSLEKLALMPGVLYIESDPIAGKAMDSARAVSNIDYVLEGVGLDKKYDGSGVVVGIVDGGFDFTHPAFWNAKENKSIISRAWVQGREGKHPSNFEYGDEYINSDEIIKAKYDTTVTSHGSHVASIICGQTIAGAEKFHGIAQNAELVVVALKPPSQAQWKSTKSADIADGIKYIFDYAKSVNKPAVVNLSWGAQIGPHDGTSLFSQLISQLTGAGKILVASAGNNAQDYLHVKKDFTATDTLGKTYVYNGISNSSYCDLWLESWGEAGKTYSMNVAIIDPSTKVSKFETGFISCEKDSIYTFSFVDKKDTTKFRINAVKAEFNGKPHIFAEANTKKAYCFSVNMKAKEGRVHLWDWFLIDYYGINSPFKQLGDESAIPGDNEYITSDFSSGKNVVSVGAYVSRNSYLCETNQEVKNAWSLGKIAYFSSVGPTVDERIKPDIAAPGMGLIGAVSSFDPAYSAVSTQIATRVTKDDKKFPYAIMSGTSMSGPVCAGTVALMLQADPTLTPEKVINTLQATAKTDSYTGAVPNTTWGGGKLDALKAIKALKGLGVENNVESENIAYPNPFTNSISIKLDADQKAEISIVNSIGEEVYRGLIDSENSTLNNLNYLNSGVYFVKINIDGKSQRVEKIVKY